MEKKSQSRIRRIIERIVNIPMWLDWLRLKGSVSYLRNGFKRLFVPPTSEPVENFDIVKQRFDLSEKELIERQHGLIRLFYWMIMVALLVFIYTVYQLVTGSIIAFVVSLVVMLITLTLAFRYHYWAYLIKMRRLGCTVREWFYNGLLGGKP